MSTPIPPPMPPPLPSTKDEGTILAGFLLGWAALVVGSMACGMFVGMLSFIASPATAPLFVLASLMPLAAVFGLLIWFARQGKSKAVRGVLYAFLSMIGLLVLLVATCFALLAGTNFH